MGATESDTPWEVGLNVLYGGRGSSKVCILYIQYSYSANFLRMNIFDIRIRSFCEQEIYSIFVFGPQSEYEYIQYLYSVKSFINMFLFIDRQQKSLGTCIDMHQN